MTGYISGRSHLQLKKLTMHNHRLQTEIDKIQQPTAPPIAENTALDWLRDVAPEILARYENQNAFNRHKQAADLAIVARFNNVQIPLPNSLYEAVRDRNWVIGEAIELALLRYCDSPQAFNIARIDRESQDSSWLEAGRFEWHEVALTGQSYRHIKVEGIDCMRMYAIVRCALRHLLGI